MGCRNAFRICFDEKNRVLYWGDVGPNISMGVAIGPNGYDEINRTKTAGNFGWPMFVGPNEAYRNYDFQTQTMGAKFDPQRPINDSRNNSGIKELPPAREAIIWYPSTISSRFPELGSGGRSAMASLVYQQGPNADPVLKLPEIYEDRLFIHDWTRNWIQSVTLSSAGEVNAIHPFLPKMHFRKPMQISQRADGTLYVIEYGDKWIDNQDSQIVRIVYRRGNRPPVARLKLDRRSGKEPLTINCTAEESYDKDEGDTLKYDWTIDGELVAKNHSRDFSHTFNQKGQYRVGLKVTDNRGEQSTQEQLISVGNALPEISIRQPENGSFFDWGEVLKYHVSIQDEEDGTTEDHSISDSKVTLQVSYQPRRLQNGDLAYRPPGLKMMRSTTCFSCHTTDTKSGGPAYREIAKKYLGDPYAKEKLARKVVSGGSGVWGNKVMPSHPQHTMEETTEMVNWILSLATDRTELYLGGATGAFQSLAAPADPRSRGGIMEVTARYTDEGKYPLPPSSASSAKVLHVRQKKVAFFDILENVKSVEVFEGQEGLVAQFTNGGKTVLRDVNLNGIESITCRAAKFQDMPVDVEIRADQIDGQLLARFMLNDAQDSLNKFLNYDCKIQDPGGLHDLVVTVQSNQMKPGEIAGISWINFVKKNSAPSKHTKVVFIPVDNVPSLQDTTIKDSCDLLAAFLNRQPQIKAIVSPEYNWPADHLVIADAHVVVFCGNSDNWIGSEPLHHQEVLLRSLGVGVIYVTSDSDGSNSPSKAPTTRVESVLDHEILAGWKSCNIQAIESQAYQRPQESIEILRISSPDKTGTLAWIEDSNEKGRKVALTLGYIPRQFANVGIRRLFAQAVLWAARQQINPDHIDTWLDPDSLIQPRTVVKSWTLEELSPLVENIYSERSYSRGKRLFKEASCSSCHNIGNGQNQLGPNLAGIASRLSKESYPARALLSHILQPSKVIHSDYKTKVVVLESGLSLSGIVQKEDEKHIWIVDDYSQPSSIKKIEKSEIEEIFDSDISLMPTGLLNTLHEDEIWDLLAYIYADGDSSHSNFQAESAED